MSQQRKTNDADGFTGNNSFVKWRDTHGGKGKAPKHAPKSQSKRTDRVEEKEVKQTVRLHTNFYGGESSGSVEDHDKDRYLITYADLITLLLGLFIILYAISNIDLNKYKKMMNVMGSIFGSKQVASASAGVLPTTGKNSLATTLERLKVKVSRIIKENKLGNNFQVLENKRGITLRIQDRLMFPSGKAKLNESFKKVLLKVANVLQTVDNDIRVEGHTDNVPIKSRLYPSNWHLSVARALNTAYFLIHKGGLNPDKVSIVGYAEYHPIADNSTPEGRAKNRRVDIVIIKK